MLYIISGASRSGKTMVAKQLSKQLEVPYLSVDFLMMGFMHGVPEMEIHDKLWPHEIAEKMWRFLEPFMETIIYSNTDYILEGEAFLPDKVSNFINKHQEHVRAVFMGYTTIGLEEKVSDVKTYAGEHDWLVQLEDEKINEHIQNMIEYSILIQKQANQFNLNYVDTSTEFLTNINKSCDLLER